MTLGKSAGLGQGVLFLKLRAVVKILSWDKPNTQPSPRELPWYLQAGMCLCLSRTVQVACELKIALLPKLTALKPGLLYRASSTIADT